MGRSHGTPIVTPDPGASAGFLPFPFRFPFPFPFPFPTSLVRLGAGLLPLLAAASACDRAAPREGLHLDALPSLSAEPDLRLGSVDDATTGFSRIGSVDVDRDGHVYVFEGVEMQIRVYDAGGRLLRRIGRSGDGPGEFRRVSRLGVVGDTVWTFDLVGDRITLFDREGNLLSTGRAESRGIGLWNQCYGYVLPWAMRADGLFTSHFGGVACNRNSPAPEIAATDPVPVPRVLFDATGAVVDTIGQDGGPPPRGARPPGASEESALQTVEVDGVPYVVPSPPTPLPHWAWLHDGRIVMTAPVPQSPEGTLTLTRIGLHGDTVYHRTYAYDARRYTSADLDELAAEAAGRSLFQRSPGAPDPAVQAQLRARMAFPEFRPATSFAEVDEDGRIWLHRDDAGPLTTRFAVLDTAGLPLGALEIQGEARLAWSSGDAAWFVENDELDVPWLVRYRIGGR